jgi:hypothetical protein
VAERIEFRIRERAGDEVEGQIEIGEREEGEQQLNELVDELDVKQNLTPDCMIGVPDLLEVEE